VLCRNVVRTPAEWNELVIPDGEFTVRRHYCSEHCLAIGIEVRDREIRQHCERIDRLFQEFLRE
jgi:hypothetical protein